MNQTEANEREKKQGECRTGTFSLSPPAYSESDDRRVIQALDEYTAALRDGRKPSREEFQARYPDIAATLGECLEGLEFIQEAAPRLHESTAEQPAGVSTGTEDIQPNGCLGDFHILREIGRGGMGIVYEAEQISLGRRVALKVLPFAAALDPKQLQRFKNEAQAAANLHHTNIVPVYAVGCERGVHYYAMQFIEGRTLAKVIADLRLQMADFPKRAGGPPDSQSAICNLQSAIPPTCPVAGLSTEHSIKSTAHFRTVANLGIQAAEALEHAHELGIIHRDVKPANLLVDASSRLWITDFGLAHCQGQFGLTMTGDVVGTLRYMSPEQALAKRVPVDARSDVYSLGVSLYELLTLEPAYDGRNREELLRQITFEEPRPPRRRNKSIPVELETIVLKAMEKDPARRYATALELADDLKRWLSGEPIRARPANTWQRTVKWVRRRPAAAGFLAASGVAVLALLGLGVGLAFNSRLQHALNEAERFRYFQHIALAGAEWREGNIVRLEKLLDDCPVGYQRHWEWQYLKRQCHGDLLTLRGHDGGIFSIAFSPDGKRFATSSVDGTVKLWDAATGREEQTLHGHKYEAFSVAFSPDGKRLVSSGWDGTVRLWDAATGREEKNLEGHKGPVWSVKFSPDGERVASGSFDGTVRLWDASTWREEQNFQGQSAAFSPDGKLLAFDCPDQKVKIWDRITGQDTHILEGHLGRIKSIVFSPDGTRLACAGDDRTVRIWDVTTGELIRSLAGHAHVIHSLAFSPDGKRLASASQDMMVKIWDASSGREILTLRGHGNMIYSVAFSPDGTRLATTSHDGTVKFWDATNGQEPRTLRGHSGAVAGVAFSPDGERLASAGADGTVRLWHVATGQQECSLEGNEGHRGPVAAVAFNDDGSQLASASADKTVKIWDVKTGHVIRQLMGHAAEVRSVAFGPAGKALASADAEGTIKVWEAATGKKVHDFKGHDREVRSLTFSADGRQLASASADRMVKVWNTGTGQLVHQLKGHLCWVHCVAFSPDLNRFASTSEKGLAEEHDRLAATRLASASGDGNVQIWDAGTGEPAVSIPGLGDYVSGVAFSRDGTRLASAAGFIRFWDVRTGQEVLSLKGHDASVLGVAFSPDGTRLASASQDGTIKIWDSWPLTPQAAVEREALALLDFLFARPLAAEDVVDFLRQSQSIRSEVREQALTWVARYHEEQDANRYHQASWEIARQPHLNVFQYRVALRQAETACRLAPKENSYRTTLGVAQYRAGRLQDALVTLTRVEQGNQDAPAGRAFLAMTQYRLGEKVPAQAALIRLRKAMEQPRWTKDAEAHGFLGEAESLMQPR